MSENPATRMGTYFWPALVVTLLIGVLAGWWFAPRHQEQATQQAEQTQPAAAAREQIYTCSMHPQVRTNDPNEKCPICAMELIPVPADEDGDSEQGELPSLRLTQRAIALMQVQVQPAQRRDMTMPVRVFGQLDFDETRLRTIAAWTDGRLDRLYVDSTGVAVQAGQPLVELYSPQLIAAQQELLQAIAASAAMEPSGSGRVRERTAQSVDAARDRLALLGVDRQHIDRLESTGQVQDHLIIPAPVSGVVVERLLAAGDYVQTGQPVYRLADLSQLWLQLEVFESDLPWLALGQSVQFTTRSDPGSIFEGTVAFIEPMFREGSRTVRVRVQVDNEQGKLKPGMFVRGTLEGQLQADPQDEPPLVIPATAPLLTGERAVVYVQLPDMDRPTFEARDVLLGPRAGGWYVVLEGIEPGEQVVVHGAFKIDSELQIRGRPSMMQPDGGRPPGHDHGAGDGSGDAHGAHGPPAHVEAEQAPAAFQSKLGQLVKANFELARALADDNPQAARQAARGADQALQAIDAATLTDERAQRRWQQLSRAMHEALTALQEQSQLAEQRDLFEPFSDALTQAVLAYGAQDIGPVYQAMCPMVHDRKGYWLQDTQVIANPYWGSGMLRCGEITRSLMVAGPQEHDHE